MHATKFPKLDIREFFQQNREAETSDTDSWGKRPPIVALPQALMQRRPPLLPALSALPRPNWRDRSCGQQSLHTASTLDRKWELQ